MEIDLGPVTLKSGEEARLYHVIAPEPLWWDRVATFLAHKGHTFLWPMEVAFREGLSGLRMNCFECVLDGEVVGNITTVDALERPVGILQHVFTNPDHRRKGICQQLMRVLGDDFLARGGQAMFLSTGYDSPAHWIYHSFGFRAIAETGLMGWLPEEGFHAEYFSPGPVSVRDTQWPDWPCLDALYLTTGGWYLRGFLASQYGHSSYEGAYPTMVEAREKGQVTDIKMLAKADGAVMGHAFVGPDSRWRGNPYVLDFFVHPNFHGEAAKLLNGLSLPTDRKVQCYADGAAGERCAALEAMGFAQEATLKRQIKKGEEWVDVVAYARL